MPHSFDRTCVADAAADDDESFFAEWGPKKGVKRYFQPETLSEILRHYQRFTLTSSTCEPWLLHHIPHFSVFVKF